MSIGGTQILDVPPVTIAPGPPVPGIDLTLPRVATGEPAQIGDLGDQLGDGAVTLEQHAAVIRTAAACVAPTWQGEAAASYQSLSVLVAAHFQSASHTLRDASQALKRYQAELARCKREGMTAVREAQHWIDQARADHAKLTTAQTDAANAQRALTDAQTQQSGALARGPAGAAAATAAAGRAALAAGQLRDAQGRIRTAQTALKHDEQELRLWQARGRRAWEEAEAAAQRATGSLLPLLIVPPPLAGLPAVPALAGDQPFVIGGCQEQPGTTAYSSSGARAGIAARLASIGAPLASLLTAIAAGLARGAEDVGDAVLEKLGTENTAQVIERVGGALDGHVPGAGAASTAFAGVIRAGGPSAVRAGIEMTLRDLTDAPGLEKVLEGATQKTIQQLSNRPPYGH